MSRTYRLKNQKPVYLTSEEEYEVNKGSRWFRRSVLKPTYAENLKAEKAIAKSDSGWVYFSGYWFDSVPSEFVSKYCTRPRRRSAKQEIHNAIRSGDYDVVMEYPRHIKDAGWMYW